MRLKLIPLLLLSLFFLGCKTEEEKKQARFEELLSCKPETPLSKGELYELAMQDYWKQQMEWVWSADKYLIEKQEEEGYGSGWLAPSVDKKMATKKCGLTWTWLGNPDKITKDTCYPRKITQYHSFEDLVWTSDRPEKTFEVFMENRGATFYHSESDPPIYTAEYYNKPVDFSIVDSAPGRYNVYPKDCCTLMTYKEVKAFDEEHGEKWIDGIWIYGIDIDELEEYTLEKYINEDYYFLIIKHYWWSTNKRGYDISNYYYPISHCGQLITY